MYQGNTVDWCKKQQDVSLSTTEAEYKQLTYGMKQTVYLINLLQEEMKIQIIPETTYEDNQGAILLARQPTISMRTKTTRFITTVPESK
jgi:hypothetical protein